jgi:hypothetical protein
MAARYLSIYLNDHLAGATLGVELARRALQENRDDELLQWLVPQVEEDRALLLRLMARRGVEPSLAKSGFAWLAEKAGRLKPNGHVVTYSPLSRLLELEGLAAGIEAKLALWLALQESGAGDDELPTLIVRAREQRERLEPLRLAAARAALT